MLCRFDRLLSRNIILLVDQRRRSDAARLSNVLRSCWPADSYAQLLPISLRSPFAAALYLITLLLLQKPLRFIKLTNTEAVYRGAVEQVIWLRQGYTGSLQRQVQGMDFTGVQYSINLQRRGYRKGWEQLF